MLQETPTDQSEVVVSGGESEVPVLHFGSTLWAIPHLDFQCVYRLKQESGRIVIEISLQIKAADIVQAATLLELVAQVSVNLLDFVIIQKCLVIVSEL